MIDVYPPQAVASEIGAALYVQSVTDDAIIANSSVAMNGRKVTIKLNADVTAYNMSGTGAFIGEPLDVAALNPMDTIGVYGTFVPEDSEEESVVTHIFVTSKPVESPVYWRADAYYDSTNKTTARIPDENGAYTIKWFVDGETVELKCKDEEMVAAIDKADYHWCHWGLEFDKDGYIVATLNSALSSRTLLQCERFDITELYDDGSYVATSLIKNNGSFVQGTVGPDCKIYDVSQTARSEWQFNRQVDSLQLGDRVCIWTDTAGNPVLIYVTNRLVESDIYWNVTRSYNSTTQQTTRTPNADGLYEFELLRVDDKKNTIYYAKDIETASRVDECTDYCVGLKLSEGNIIEYAYPSECLFGNTYFSRGYFLIDITGSVGTYLSNAGSGFSKNGVLAAGCKVINVSTVGEYGAETTLGFGDSVHAYCVPNGEIAHIFVSKRLTGPESMYYRFSSRMYDAEKKETTREPDENGYYVYEFTNRGKTVTLRTKDKAVANKVDGASRADMGLTVKGDIILEVHDYSYPFGGNTNSGYYIKEINGDKITIWNTSGKQYEETLADNYEVYNVSTSWLDHRGEKTKLQVGDYVNIYRDVYYNVGCIYIAGRQTNKMAWPVDQQLDPNGGTARTPDADGWYYIDLAVDGKVSTYKTKNKNVIDAAESYNSAFGIKVSGNEILYTSTYSYVENVFGRGVVDYTVTAVSGNTVKTLYTLGHATATGTTNDLTLNEGVKIFDVSDSSSPDFGKVTKLQVGDVIRTFTYLNDRTLTQYVFIVGHSTRAGGYRSYCDHCDKVVYWNPYISAANAVRYDCHYFLAADVNHDSQMRVYGNSQENLEIVLDLNGHTLSRDAGRLVFVRYGATLTILDSVGGGQIKSRNNTSIGGVLSVGGPEEDYGPATLNLYGGTVTMDTDEGVTDYAYRGGLVTSNGIFNMYGGEIVGGFVRGKNSSGSSAAGVQINDGEFNMYGGKIADCIADGGSYEVPVKDKDGNPVIDETTGLPKVDKKIITSYAGNLHVNGVNAVVNMYGGSIENGKAARGGNVTVGNGTFIMHDGLISGGVASAQYGATSDGRGGNFFVTGKSNVIIKGGTVTGGKAIDGSGMGGNFIGSSVDSTIYIEGGTVTDGEAKSGNNVALMYSHLNVSGGKVLQGAVTTGTNVSATGTTSGYSTVTISGGKVDGEVLLTGGVSTDASAKYPDYRAIANISGGEVETLNATNVQKITVSGNPVIENLQVGGGVLLDVGAMTNGANITMKTTGVFTKPVENAANYTGYFHTTEEGYLTGVTAQNELRFYNPNATLAYCEHCKAEAEWMPWDGKTVVTGHYYLADNAFVSDRALIHLAGTNAVFNMYGGTVTGGKAQTNIDTTAHVGVGGNIYVSTGTLNMYGGTISNGTTTDLTNGDVTYTGMGGNIYASDTAVINIYGGTITGGTSSLGADIYLAAYSSKGGILNVSGGVINGEVYVAGAKATVTVSGTANIGNLNLQGESVVNVGSLATGAKIGITKVGDFTAVLEDAERYLPFFTSVDNTYVVDVTADNKLALVSNNACPCGCGMDKDQVTWVDPAAYMNAAAASWNYKLTENVHFRLESDFDVDTFFNRQSQVQIGVDANTPANVTIDLNGNTWSNSSRFMVLANSVLTILDTSAEQTGRVLVTGDSGTGGMAYVSGTINLLSGTLTMKEESLGQYKWGGIIYVNGGVFNMYGGSVINGRTLGADGKGGNVLVLTGGFNMYGGTISGGAATVEGDNVYISANCVFNFVGGTIDDYDNTVVVK